LEEILLNVNSFDILYTESEVKDDMDKFIPKSTDVVESWNDETEENLLNPEDKEELIEEIIESDNVERDSIDIEKAAIKYSPPKSTKSIKDFFGRMEIVGLKEGNETLFSKRRKFDECREYFIEEICVCYDLDKANVVNGYLCLPNELYEYVFGVKTNFSSEMIMGLDKVIKEDVKFKVNRMGELKNVVKKAWGRLTDLIKYKIQAACREKDVTDHNILDYIRIEDFRIIVDKELTDRMLDDSYDILTMQRNRIILCILRCLDSGGALHNKENEKLVKNLKKRMGKDYKSKYFYSNLEIETINSISIDNRRNLDFLTSFIEENDAKFHFSRTAYGIVLHLKKDKL